MDDANETSAPAPAGSSPRLEYIPRNMSGSRPTVAEFVGGVTGGLISLSLFAGAAAIFVGACYIAVDGMMLGAIAGFFGFFILLACGFAALAGAVGIMRGLGRLPQGFQDASEWQESISASFIGIVGVALLALSLLLAPAVLAESHGLPETIGCWIALLMMLLISAICVRHATIQLGILSKALRLAKMFAPK